MRATISDHDFILSYNGITRVIGIEALLTVAKFKDTNRKIRRTIHYASVVPKMVPAAVQITQVKSEAMLASY